MKTEKIVLDQERGVVLYAYLNRWTSATFGGRPRRGAVVVCPGGAFMVHAGGEGEPIALAFLAAGYQSFFLRYGIGRHAKMPRPILDAALAIACIRAHAEEWDIDPDKIAICGFSAGGYIASALGTMWTRDRLQALCGKTGEEIRPNAMILCYPLTHVDPQENQVTKLVYGSDIPPELFIKYSPLHNVGPHTPPTFLWNMYQDTMIPVETGLQFCAALAAHDVPFELHTFQDGSHGMGLANEVTSLGCPDLEDVQVSQWFQLCRNWLKKRFGPPTLPSQAIVGFKMPQGRRAHPGEANIPDSLK